MLVQKRHPGESLPAGFAAVLLDFRVGLQVCAEVGPVGKRSLAVRARKGLLTSVRADVSLEQPRTRESLPAELALARESMSPDVHFECAEGHVFLVAVLAVEGFLVLRVAVELSVLAEPAECRVLFAAIRAVVLGAVLAVLGAASLLDLLLRFHRGGRGGRCSRVRRRLQMLLLMLVAVMGVVPMVLVVRQRRDHAILVIDDGRRSEKVVESRLRKMGVERLRERWRRAVAFVNVREGVGLEG